MFTCFNNCRIHVKQMLNVKCALYLHAYFECFHVLWVGAAGVGGRPRHRNVTEVWTYSGRTVHVQESAHFTHAAQLCHIMFSHFTFSKCLRIQAFLFVEFICFVWTCDTNDLTGIWEGLTQMVLDPIGDWGKSIWGIWEGMYSNIIDNTGGHGRRRGHLFCPLH